MKQPMEINIFLKQSVENSERNNNESENRSELIEQ